MQAAAQRTFDGADRFYITSCPAHRGLLAKLTHLASSEGVKLSATKTFNKHTINQFVHPFVMECFQLVLGYMTLEDSFVWNIITSHIHDRRMEAYLYFDIDEKSCVLHLWRAARDSAICSFRMRKALISPPGFIHSGVAKRFTLLKRNFHCRSHGWMNSMSG